jgi:hypothetical protein
VFQDARIADLNTWLKMALAVSALSDAIINTSPLGVTKSMPLLRRHQRPGVRSLVWPAPATDTIEKSTVEGHGDVAWQRLKFRSRRRASHGESH